MAPYWMRLSPQQAVGWYCVPKDIAHQPQHAFYGLNLTEEDMRNGWWMTNRAFFAVLASADFPLGWRLHIATIDGDLFGEDFYDNILEPAVRKNIRLSMSQAVTELAELLLQHAEAPASSQTPFFLPISVDDLSAKGIRFEEFQKSSENHYYREKNTDNGSVKQVVQLDVTAQSMGISFHRYDFNRSKLHHSSFETPFLDISREGLWELANLIKDHMHPPTL